MVHLIQHHLIQIKRVTHLHLAHPSPPPPSLPCRENRAFLKLLADGVNPEGSGRSLFFSYFYDVTLTAQRTAVVARDPSPTMQTSAARAEPQFFWNAAMSRPLIEAGAHR